MTTEQLHAKIDGMTDEHLASEIDRLLVKHRDKGLSSAESQLYDLLTFAQMSREDADAERPL